MRLSLAWAERCKRAFEGASPGRALFGIVQGGDDAGLRIESARALTDIGFPGYAIGGLAVGEPQEVMLKMVEEVAPALPADRPRYLMGVGRPDDLIEAVARGIDMFDCVMPTRDGRHGRAFTRFGAINLRNARHAEDPRPLDEQSPCEAARIYSRAYLHHLMRADEMLGAMLLSEINLAYYQELMQGIRAAIGAGTFADFQRRDARRLGARRYSCAETSLIPLDGKSPQVRMPPTQRRYAPNPGRLRDGGQPDSERGDALRAGRAGYPAALCAAQRFRAERRQVRLRAVAMRRLHGAGERAGGALLRDADRAAQRARRSPRSKASAPWRSRTPCSAPSSPSRPRNAATASAA